MALPVHLLSGPCSLPSLAPPVRASRHFNMTMRIRCNHFNMTMRIRCNLSTEQKESATTRRSGNYPKSFGDYDFIQSLKSDYKLEMYETKLEKLKEEVRSLLRRTNEPVDQMMLIDTIQRLGVGHHFKKEIKQALTTMSIEDNNKKIKQDLYATSLRFRLLRQHGFVVSQDVFNQFKDEKGEFMASLWEDIKGLLNLYEASYLSFQGETVLDEARAFSIMHLKDLQGNTTPQMKRQVEHALERPYHWRMIRLEARWCIEAYVEDEDMNPLLFELAKLDYNMVQALYQSEVKPMARWWRNVGLHKHLTFARSRLMECFLWAVGFTSEPELGHSRRGLVKVNQLITTIDDVYDIYGSLEELELFTDAVDRWDVKAMEKLPQYMQICFLALFNSVNEMAYDTLTEQGWEITGHLKRGWAELCKSYLIEAKWYKEGYIPTLDEYLNNAWISIGGPVILISTYFFIKPKITKESLELIESNPNLIQYSSMIFRLCDDLGTSVAELERGDVLKAKECYMHQTGASEAVAREHIWGLIDELWKKMNKESFSCSPFARSFINVAWDVARMAQLYYQNGDAFGSPNDETKERTMLLVAKPISVLCNK